MAVTTTNLGVITAYGDAVAAGYTGTKAEWQTLMASYATVGQQAVDAKDDAVAAKDIAVQKAADASAAAGTATQKANDASASAQSIAQSASQIAQNTSDISELKEDFATMESDGVVPSADQILTDKGVTDCVPYHYRKTGGNGADREYVDAIVGGTVRFNQLMDLDDDSWTILGGNVSVSATNGKIVINGTSNVASTTTLFPARIYNKIKPIKGHRHLLSVVGKTGFNLGFYIYGSTTQTIGIGVLNGSVTKIFTGNVDTPTDGELVGTFSNGETVTADFCVYLVDLTAMFGAEIADYIYNLEQSTAGAGVALFKSLFPNDYYPYDAGTLKSVEGLSEHKMVGFNQWDEEWELGGIIWTTGEPYTATDRIRSKNFCDCLPNTKYYVRLDYNGGVIFYDSDKAYIERQQLSVRSEITSPSNARYFKLVATDITTYNHDICINLSDPAKNGQYEPYKAHSYPLDDSLTLRGLFKLDANNNLYADGDTYEYTGKVTRNTILRAYQSGDESLANAITDGTNTVVYSANASTEQAQPYQHLQQCNPNGTEEYVSTGIVPVGHNTQYPENLKAKIEGLPWNFANLIAPTEATFTATRNYTTGALFIVNNVLYKATSNIANGGTITPNTNCTATTLAEIISALA